MHSELRKYDAIRPFEPEELPEVYDRLLADPQFQAVLRHLYPETPLEMVARKMRACKTNLEFQKVFCYEFLKDLMARAADGFEMDASQIDPAGRYTFVSNHRDIVLDASLLDVMLLDSGCDTTCEIAIGDNLLSLPWVRDLVRVNKSFIVHRGVSMREMLRSSKLMSEYMHYVIAEKKDNIWIAQRSGRAKDSDDRTSETVLKMMTMGGEGSVVERLKALHIVPLSISYEYDPCDFLKAAELQQRRDDANWKKGPKDDIISMRTGIMGYKGHVHYYCAPCVDGFLDAIPADMPKADVLGQLARHMDRAIHSHYKLYPSNYIALDELSRGREFASKYTDADRLRFERYLAGQMAKVELPHKDEAYLRERILTMYANPAINAMAAKQG